MRRNRFLMSLAPIERCDRHQARQKKKVQEDTSFGIIIVSHLMLLEKALEIGGKDWTIFQQEC